MNLRRYPAILVHMEAVDNKTDFLCDDCSTVLPYSPFKDGSRTRVVTYPGFPELKASAQKGCKICFLFLENLGVRFNRRFEEFGQKVYRIQDRSLVANWDRKVTISNPRFSQLLGGRWIECEATPVPYMTFQEQLEFSVFEVWADTGDAAALHGGIRSKLPDEDSLSNANRRLIFGWLDSCVAEHTSCCSEKLPRLPTRVIDVGSLNGLQKPRLVVTDRRPSRYSALSHCWGDQTDPEAALSLRLLECNIDELQIEIPMASLPRTFQEAIETLRKLEIRYLWIDALCIIQDSKADWEYESARMNDVYECSYLTIVATSAKSSTDGFLKRPERQVVNLPYRNDVDPTLAGKFQLTRPLVGRYPWYSVDKTAWNTRGWTYQERISSRRLLHFGTSALFWECRTTDRSEVNAQRLLKDRPRWVISRTGRQEGNVGDLNLHRQYERWYMIVREFSPRQLTYRSDSLSALSGLASIFKEAYTKGEDEYIAGLWLRDFPHGLLWTVEVSSETSRAPDPDYWAPTWSWASIAGEVYWPARTIERHQRDDFTVELLGNELRVAKENPMGTVLGGHIRMRGRLRSLSCITKPVEWGALLRYRYDLWCNGQVIGNGSVDVDADETAEGAWLLQMHLQQPGDCFFPYHPTALIVQILPGSWMKFVRIGCAVLDDEKLDFFDLCTPQEFEFY